MDKESFYKGKNISSIEWWISSCSEFPDIYWARLRVYIDGSADVAFDEAEEFGFTSRVFASYFLSEDEYTPFNSLDEDEKKEIGIKGAQLVPPVWRDGQCFAFRYIGEY
jgi:hypothetical protein